MSYADYYRNRKSLDPAFSGATPATGGQTQGQGVGSFSGAFGNVVTPPRPSSPFSSGYNFGGAPIAQSSGNFGSYSPAKGGFVLDNNRGQLPPQGSDDTAGFYAWRRKQRSPWATTYKQYLEHVKQESQKPRIMPSGPAGPAGPGAPGSPMVNRP